MLTFASPLVCTCPQDLITLATLLAKVCPQDLITLAALLAPKCPRHVILFAIGWYVSSGFDHTCHSLGYDVSSELANLSAVTGPQDLITLATLLDTTGP